MLSNSVLTFCSKVFRFYLFWSTVRYFINFYPYFNSYFSFRQEYFSFRPYFCLIADIKELFILPLPFHHSLFRKIKFITKQSTTSYPLHLIWFAAQTPCICQSRTSVSVGSQRSLRQYDGDCTANTRRMQYDSTETALQIEKFLKRLKNFCSLATPLRMRWDSLRMHWDCAETLKTEKCSIRGGVAVKFAKVWEQH